MMNQEELLKLQKKLKASMLETWKLHLQIDKILNSSPQDETPKVITNELTKEVGCINCIRHYSPNSKDCKTCDENYSNYNQLVGSAPSKGDL